MKELYPCFGILNLFCPYRPNGSYLFNLAIYEEKLVCKLILELCKTEGWANISGVKLNGKELSKDKLNADLLTNLPAVGTFECTYNCPPEKTKDEFRGKLGVKYLDWPASV